MIDIIAIVIVGYLVYFFIVSIGLPYEYKCHTQNHETFNFLTGSDWPQLRGLAILALRGARKFFAVLNVLGEDFMVFWRAHDELFNHFPEEFKNSKSFSSGSFYFRFVLPDSLF